MFVNYVWVKSINFKQLTLDVDFGRRQTVLIKSESYNQLFSIDWFCKCGLHYFEDDCKNPFLQWKEFLKLYCQNETCSPYSIALIEYLISLLQSTKHKCSSFLVLGKDNVSHKDNTPMTLNIFVIITYLYFSCTAYVTWQAIYLRKGRLNGSKTVLRTGTQGKTKV